MSAGGTVLLIGLPVKEAVWEINNPVVPREPVAPALVLPDAFIEWGGPSIFDDNFRNAALNPGGSNEQPRDHTILRGTFVEEARTWDDFEVSNPDDSGQTVLCRRTSAIAFKAPFKTTQIWKNQDVSTFDQVEFSFSNGGEAQAPIYHNHKGVEFKPVVLDPLSQIVEVGWGGPYLLILFGHYPETNMAGGEGKALLGLANQDNLINAIDVQASEQYPADGTDKTVHYKGLFTQTAKLTAPSEDPPEDDDDMGPKGDGWIGTPPEPVNVGRSDYGLKNPVPGGDPIPVVDGNKADHYVGPGVAQGKGGRVVFFDGYFFRQLPPIQIEDGTWVAQFAFEGVTYPSPGTLAPGMHLGGLGGSGEVFDSAGNHGGFTDPTAPPKIPPDPPDVDFVGNLMQWRIENISSVRDDGGTFIDDYWTYRLWTKKGKQKPKDDGCAANVVGFFINITKPLKTAQDAGTGDINAYTLGLRYGGTEKNDKFKSDAKRGAQLRAMLLPRSTLDDAVKTIKAASTRVGDDHDKKWASLDELMDQFDPNVGSPIMFKKMQMPNVTDPYGMHLQITVNFAGAGGLDVNLEVPSH